MKTSTRILVAVVGIGVAAFFLFGQQSEKAADQPAPMTNAAPAALEFAESDLLAVAPNELSQLLPLTGSLRPVNQAVVKAPVSGEVKEVLVREGEAVRAQQVIIRMDTRDYDARVNQARGQLAAAQGQLEIANNARKSNQALLDQGFISRNAFDNASSQYDIARANADSARAALDVAQKALNDTVVRSPITGLVASRTIQPGEKVSIDNPLMEILDLSQLELAAAVPAAEIGRVSLKQAVQVRVEGIADMFAGEVVRINPSTEAGSRSIMVFIQIANAQASLRAGMFAEAQLVLSSKNDVLLLPQAAIRRDGEGTFVYAVEEDKLVRKGVEVGLAGSSKLGSAVEITSGLQAGDVVVRNNLGSLQLGTPVRVTRAANDEAATHS